MEKTVKRVVLLLVRGLGLIMSFGCGSADTLGPRFESACVQVLESTTSSGTYEAHATWHFTSCGGCERYEDMRCSISDVGDGRLSVDGSAVVYPPPENRSCATVCVPRSVSCSLEGLTSSDVVFEVEDHGEAEVTLSQGACVGEGL